ncbi:hypothetical protein PPERSA_10739 [Pseudocohnilembus persalinus]|uniref:Transmembrane protein n=1 Tax=Pseudocohnilembus persalinus TaxID=266149 RepID=A0A0V0QDP1_PSEPJ|nr:hypothetical protein PPERSA_10739 [Pseudocohnilembus persalinus]|eukprot:KRX00240.1 hypothetical protein PPERSA_10739 [Pseudocohnilembus persalinus]
MTDQNQMNSQVNLNANGFDDISILRGQDIENQQNNYNNEQNDEVDKKDQKNDEKEQEDKNSDNNQQKDEGKKNKSTNNKNLVKQDKNGKKIKPCCYRFKKSFTRFLSCFFINPVMIFLTFIIIFILCIVSQYGNWAYLQNNEVNKTIAYIIIIINIASVCVGNLFWLGKFVKKYVQFFVSGLSWILYKGERGAYKRESKHYISTIKYADGSKEEEIEHKSGSCCRFISYIFAIIWIFRWPALFYIYRKNKFDAGISNLIFMIISWTVMTQIIECGVLAGIMYENNDDLRIWDKNSFAKFDRIEFDFLKLKNEFSFIINCITFGITLLFVPFQIYFFNKKIQLQQIQNMKDIILKKGSKFKFYFGCTKQDAKTLVLNKDFKKTDGIYGSGIYLHRVKIFAEKDQRNPKSKPNEEILELLVDVKDVFMIQSKATEPQNASTLYVPKGVIDTLLEYHVIKDSFQIVTVLNAKKIVENYQENEETKKLIPIEEQVEIKYMYSFFTEKVKSAREINLNKAYELAILEYYEKNATKQIKKQYQY